MNNTVPFGARIVATWNALVENLQARTSQAAVSDNGYHDALAYFGRKALEAGDRNLIRKEGCRAIILACIKQGLDTRDDIVRAVPYHHDCSHRWTAYLLDEATGTDPTKHLWQKGGDGRYTLLVQ